MVVLVNIVLSLVSTMNGGKAKGDKKNLFLFDYNFINKLYNHKYLVLAK